MHGCVLHGFKKFVFAREGESAWNELIKAAGVSGWYIANRAYPDADLKLLIGAAAERWHQPVAALLREFGEALVPTLLGLYGSFLERNWRTLDVLLNTESVIHRTVRMRDPAATPPALRCSRTGDSTVEIEYSSPRRLCAVADGICHGIAAHYGEQVDVTQPRCMERGDASCTIVVRVFGP